MYLTRVATVTETPVFISVAGLIIIFAIIGLLALKAKNLWERFKDFLKGD